ncbi:PepSY domain-containing protein [Peteryoungia ipomoeae]|uniref:PepSY domain-containing protein n=1 Tax=Peteryoungia ipomoeae TaxID=1210932 RepID=A0A4S8P658_9HYPH|nr:PepSY domain-containing protein [Peteryoungia ipomoeae]THV24715.1 PepSY domain-containing protein [Peteryoungia ipomoeae]
MKTLIAASMFAVLASAGLVHADDDDRRCSLGAGEVRLSLAEIEKKAAAEGIETREIELDDGCWEVKGLRDGLRVEAVYHPVTGALLAHRDD